MLSKTLAMRSFGHHVPKKIQPKQTQLLIDGKFVNSISGKTFDTFNPATEEKITSVQEADRADVDVAVKAARKAFDEGPWRRMDPAERGKIMHRLADLIDKHGDEIAALEALDNGKPAKIARIADVPLTSNSIRYYAGWCDKIHGKTLPISGPHFAYLREEPVGVVGQIIPWNFPAAMMAWKIGPALATGCTTIVKTAE
jgi:aldehyde dehydrogenase (NAD+)